MTPKKSWKSENEHLTEIKDFEMLPATLLFCGTSSRKWSKSVKCETWMISMFGIRHYCSFYEVVQIEKTSSKIFGKIYVEHILLKLILLTNVTVSAGNWKVSCLNLFTKKWFRIKNQDERYIICSPSIGYYLLS